MPDTIVRFLLVQVEHPDGMIDHTRCDRMLQQIQRDDISRRVPPQNETCLRDADHLLSCDL